MAVGWAGDNAVNEQIEATVSDEIERARRNIRKGESLKFCEECGEPIPEARRRAVPGVRLCIKCQEEYDRTHGPAQLYNRRGSKDSQLK
ncbi:MAG: DksA C4-type domain-containing protein [Burkholderia sp.]|jgi:phage/conjugal plasmid C-4 type zinc finger TraR family protein